MTPKAYQVRDAAMALFGSSELFKFRSVVPVEFEPDDQLPGLVIAAIEERMTPEGDLASGEPRFTAVLTLGIVVRVQGNDREDLEKRVQRRTVAVLSTMLRAPAYRASVDGFADVVTTPSYWKDGERFFGQEETKLQVQYPLSFPPIIEDDLEVVRIITRQLGANPKAPELETVINLP